MHMFWQWDLLKSFWNSIPSFTKSVLEIEFDLNPYYYLLNDMPDFQLDLKKKKMQNINFYNIFC